MKHDPTTKFLLLSFFGINFQSFKIDMKTGHHDHERQTNKEEFKLNKLIPCWTLMQITWKQDAHVRCTFECQASKCTISKHLNGKDLFFLYWVHYRKMCAHFPVTNQKSKIFCGFAASQAARMLALNVRLNNFCGFEESTRGKFVYMFTCCLMCCSWAGS